MINYNHLALIILDGWGIAQDNEGNAITRANPDFFYSLWNKYPHTQLCASSECVGVFKGQPGNSEAGHTTIGAGRVIEDDAVFISKSIKNGSFFRNGVFWEGVHYVQEHKSKVHLIGLATEKNSAHSSPLHWLAMLDFLKRAGIKKVYLHLFTDGRDSSPHSAAKIINRFFINHKKGNNQKQSKGQNNQKLEVVIASIIGRFYAMDRCKKWERTKKAYDLLTLGKGIKVKNPLEGILQAYNRKETDEFISPTVIVDEDNQPVATIDDKDFVIFMNLRSDRARQLTKCFVQKGFNRKNPGSFIRKKVVKDLMFVALTDFGPDLDHTKTAFPSIKRKDTLPLVLGKERSQLYIAETEKYAHVTFFFNGGYSKPVAGEKRIRISSPKVAHYDETPAMSTPEVTARLLEEVNKKKYNFILVNFCNPDMLGHTGNIQATIQGIKVVDKYLKQLVKTLLKYHYALVITADHGNAEEMINLRTKEILTSHTTNPVPFILVSENNLKLRKQGGLADIAPTILDILNIPCPKRMTGKSLII